MTFQKVKNDCMSTTKEIYKQKTGYKKMGKNILVKKKGKGLKE